MPPMTNPDAVSSGAGAGASGAALLGLGFELLGNIAKRRYPSTLPAAP